jgi:hypothetical protein
MPKVFEIENFAKGYDDSLAEDFAPPESTQHCLYTDYARRPGTIAKSLGESSDIGDNVAGKLVTVQKPATGSEDIQLIYEGRIDASGTGGWLNKRFIVAGGKVYQYCSGDYLIRLNSGDVLFHTTDLLDATHYINNFYIAGGYDYAIRTWNGLNNSVDTVTSLEGGTNHYRAKYVEIYRNRLFMADTSESTDGGVTWTAFPNTVRYSDLGAPTRWDSEDIGYVDANYVSILDKEGDEIVRIMAFADALIIFKRNSIHKLTYTGGDLPFERTEIDLRAWGNAGFTVAKVPQGLLFLNQEGLQYTDGTKVENLASAKKVAGILSPYVLPSISYLGSQIDYGELEKFYAVSNDTTYEYSVAFSLYGETALSHMLTWNWKYDTWKVRNMGTSSVTKDTPVSCLGIFTEEPTETNAGQKKFITGRHDGTLTEDTTTGYGIGGNDYPDCYHITPWLDFGSPGKQKEVIKLQVLWELSFLSQMTVSYQGSDDWTGVANNPVFTDLPVVTGGGNTVQTILPMRALGRRFRFRFSMVGQGQYFYVYSMKIFYNERDIR